MAAAMKIKAAPDLLSVSFNQDYSCVSTGTRKGYTITNCDPFGKVYEKNEGAASIVEMLFCTSLVAYVGAADRPQASPRQLHIVNTKRQSNICELTFPTTILAVRLNRKRLVVVLEDQIYIYDISNMKLLHTIDTGPNPSAICALTPSSQPSYLAYPSPSTSSSSPQSSAGDVLLFDTLSLSVTSLIPAHKSPLSFLALNSTGTHLATASDKGTVIRVFGIPSGDRLHEFRRGSYPTRIWSVSFNAMTTLLAVASQTETVHIFKLGAGTGAGGRDGSADGRRAASVASSQWGEDESEGGYEAFIESTRSKSSSVTGTLRRRSMNFGGKLVGGVGGFLPGAVTSMWDPQRDFASLKLPSSGVKSVVAISSTTPTVMVVTSEGFFYQYAIDLENGGECLLQKSWSLLDGPGAGADP